MAVFEEKEIILCDICGEKAGLLKKNLKDGVICWNCSNKINTLDKKLITLAEAKEIIKGNIKCNVCNELLITPFIKKGEDFICEDCIEYMKGGKKAEKIKQKREEKKAYLLNLLDEEKKKELCLCDICGKKAGILKTKLKDGVLCNDCTTKIDTLEYKGITLDEAKKLMHGEVECNGCGKVLLGKFTKIEDSFMCAKCIENKKKEEKIEKLKRKEIESEEKIKRKEIENEEKIKRKEIENEEKVKRKKIENEEKIKRKEEEKVRKAKEAEEREKRSKILIEKAKNFKPTANVGKYVYFNDNDEEIYVPNRWGTPDIIKYGDILGVELLEDGNSRRGGGIGGAALGGALFGDTGAIIGAISGSGKEVVKHVQIKITTKDLNNPVVFIKIFRGEAKVGGFVYNGIQKEAHQVLSMIQIAIEKKRQTSSVETQINRDNRDNRVSIVEELKGLKELLDEGILTQEEFENEKKKILNN